MDTPDLTTTKRCTKCGELKPREAFSKSASAKDGLSFRCKECVSEYHRRYYETNGVRVREHVSRYRESNRDEISERKRRYRAENIEKESARARRYRNENAELVRGRKRLYYEANAEKVREAARRWGAEHAEERRALARIYYAEHTEEKRAYQHQWYLDNPDKVCVHRLTRRARKAGNGGATTAADIDAIRAAQTDKRGRLICWKCGKPIKDTPDLDHWIPLKHGGPNDAGNLHYMHAKCNRSKGAKMPTEIGRLL